MKVIVFGGSGFLGSHVADALTDAGHNVIVYDLVRSQYLKNGQKMIVGDVLDEGLVSKSMKGCEVVYNFAGIADIEEASKRPIDTVKSNILGNSVLLESARKAGIKRFVFASSLYVYSKAGSFYRSAKQACEFLIEDYHEVYGLPYTILRYGSLYGPRSDKGNFIHRIIREALTEGKIRRYGDGEELREYIHVFDASKGSVEILAKEFANQHVILTGNQQLRIKDLLVMIREMFDNKIDIEFLSPRENGHYEITPYSFKPRIGKRLASKTYLDLSQGILDSIYEMHKQFSPRADHAVKAAKKKAGK
ncbi:MAG: NAD(P)-dependent oxidoreductase [Candidatus Omnitrophota bacterium]|jgi:UDP-glucose 4-epimerase